MNLSEPLSLGMLFDAAIQQGGASTGTVNTIAAARAANPSMTEMALRRDLAELLTAQIKSDRFRADVAARRRTFIGGRGQVHGANFDLGFWGFFAANDENETNISDAITPPPSTVLAASVPGSFQAFFDENIKPIAPDFKASEFLIKGGKNTSGGCAGANTDPPQNKWQNCLELARILQAIRTEFGDEVVINSCYRSPAYNKCIGGAERSQHMEFCAADIRIKNGDTALSWHARILEMRNNGLFVGGLGRYGSFVHVDTRGTNTDWVG